MSVTVTSPISDGYVPNGATRTFAFNFKVASTAEIAVYQVLNGVATLINPNAYAVVLDADGEGGTVTFTVAPAAGTGTIYLVSAPLLTQTLALANDGPFTPSILNGAFDRAAIRAIFLNFQANRSLKVPLNETDPGYPNAADRANNYLTHDGAGKPVPGISTAGVDQMLTDISTNATNITNEASTRANADTVEAAARVLADNGLAASIATETGARVTAVNAEAATRAGADTVEANVRANAVSVETTARTAGDAALGTRIDAETSGRSTADAAILTAIQNAGGTLSNVIINAADRTILAALSTTLPAFVAESGREGEFVFSGANLSANVTRDTQQGVYVPPASAPSGATGAWVRKISGPLHPRHFGALMAGGDDGPALQAFFNVMTAERWAGGYSLDGYFKTGQPLTIDGGVFGADITFALNFGNCYIEALAPMNRLLTIQDSHNAMFNGRARLRGTNYGSDNIDNWGVDTGLYVSAVSQSLFGSFYMEGFGFAGLEFADGPNSDSCHWQKLVGKRVGSGSATATASKTANWSGRVDSGVSLSNAQYSTITVDNLPSAYAQANIANVPSKQLLVEINGQLCLVNYIDPGTGTLRVFPWINASSGNAGTLRFHYGAGVVMLGGDSGLEKFDQIDFNQSGCVAQFSALYGSEVGILHGEGCGSFARYGKVIGNDFGTVKVNMAYSEGNTFRHVVASALTYGIEIAADLGADNETKDYDCANTSTAGVLTALAPGFVGFTHTGVRGGHHFKAKAFPIPYASAGTAGETIDFGNANTFRGPSFYNTGARNFTLKAPTATKKTRWGYDTAYITVGGSGAGGAPNGNVTFVPPAGHTINGGAADATAVFTNSQFSGPVIFFIVQTTTTDWLIYPVNPKAPAVQSVASAATVTPTAANDQVNITAQAANLTIANPSGTAVPAKPLMIRIRDNGTGRTITFGTKYRAIGVALPTTTTANKLLYVGTRYNVDDDKWDVLTVAQEA